MRYLIRSKMPFFKNWNLYDVVNADLIGTNSGNLLFPYSIIRLLMKNGDIFDTYGVANPEDADEINDKYDIFLIPLANAFRDSFVAELKNLTKLVNKLKIPCVVIGVGASFGYEPQLNIDYEFDEAAKEFCKAILNKSTSIGVRGGVTFEYLKKLGFGEDAIQIIGCPSMYLYGASLPFKISTPINNQSKISISYHGNDDKFFSFLQKIKTEYPNYVIIPQGIRDLRLLYAGDQIVDSSIHELYVKTENDYSFRYGKMRFFLDVSKWISFLRGYDLGIGSCVHGSIASILAGNPTVLISSDSRTRELAEFHNICSIPMSIINDELSLEDIYSKMDFENVQKNHKKNYLNYLKFLEENNIDIASGAKDEGIYSAYFDEVIADFGDKNALEVMPYSTLCLDEQLDRLRLYSKICKGKMNWWAKRSGTESKEYQRWEKSLTDATIKQKRLMV